MAYIDAELDRGTLKGTMMEFIGGAGGTTPKNYHKMATFRANINSRDSSQVADSWRITIPMKIAIGYEKYPGSLVFSEYALSNGTFHTKLAGYLCAGYYSTSEQTNKDALVIYRRKDGEYYYYDFYIKAVNSYWDITYGYLDNDLILCSDIKTYRAQIGEQGVNTPSGTLVVSLNKAIANNDVTVFGTRPS